TAYAQSTGGRGRGGGDRGRSGASRLGGGSFGLRGRCASFERPCAERQQGQCRHLAEPGASRELNLLAALVVRYVRHLDGPPSVQSVPAASDTPPAAVSPEPDAPPSTPPRNARSLPPPRPAAPTEACVEPTRVGYALPDATPAPVR